MAVDLADGLIGYWKLNEGYGTICRDSSGNANPGVFVNTPTWINGIAGKALNFDGVNDAINMGNGAPLDDIGAVGDFSVSCWMRSKDTVPLSNGLIVCKGSTAGDYLDFFLSNLTSNRLRSRFDKGGSTAAINWAIPASAVFDTYWHHLVLTIDRTADHGHLSCDGVDTGDTWDISGLPNDISNIKSLSAGAYAGAAGPFEGDVDEIRIYSRVLNEDEITYLWEHPQGIQLPDEAVDAQEGIQVKVYSPSGDLVGIISDTDDTGKLLDVEVIVKEINGVDNFSFEVQKDIAIPLSENSECYFYVSGTLWFIGYIVEIPNKQQNDLTLKIKGLGLIHKLKQNLISIDFTAQTLFEATNFLGHTHFMPNEIGYAPSKVQPPATVDLTIKFRLKTIYDVLIECMKIANYDYENDRYRMYVDNERYLVIEALDMTDRQDTLFEGYNFQDPEVSEDKSMLINSIRMTRGDLADVTATDDLGYIEDTESQAKYGKFYKKLFFPDYAVQATIELIAASILERYKDPLKKIAIKNMEMSTPMPFGFYAINAKRDTYFDIVAECDTEEGWNDAALTVTTFEATDERFLTGKRSLKFVTAAGSLNDFVEYEFPNVVYFPIELRLYVFFDTTTIPLKIVIVDKDAAETEIEVEEIVDEWVKAYINIGLETDDGLLKIDKAVADTGYLKVTHDGGSGFMRISHMTNAGLTNIASVKILMNSNVVTTLFVDRIEASANMFGYSELYLKEVRYKLSAQGIFADASFGEYTENILKEIDKKVSDGVLSFELFTRTI